MTDLEWVRRDGVGRWEAEAGGGGGAFDGCRYLMGGSDGSYQTFVSGLNFADNLTTAIFFDTGDPSYGGAFDGSGLSETGYLFAPQDGYYRMTMAFDIDFSVGDATYAFGQLWSPDGDGAWDPAWVSLPDEGNQRASGSHSITQWLSEGYRVGVRLFRDGATSCKAQGTLEMQFLGAGTNPNP